MNSRAHIFADGLVQGVCFRDFTRSHAMALKLTGWVRNLPDGRVEAVVEGQKDDIESLIDCMRQGPRASRVDNLEVEWEDYAGSCKDFRISWR